MKIKSAYRASAHRCRQQQERCRHDVRPQMSREAMSMAGRKHSDEHLVLSHVGVEADALVLARQLCGLHHEILGHSEGAAGRQHHAGHGVPARYHPPYNQHTCS